jgi:hypothetical protein
MACATHQYRTQVYLIDGEKYVRFHTEMGEHIAVDIQKNLALKI